MDEKKIFFNYLREEFSPRLRELGFKGSGNHFRRVNKEVIHCINIQGNKHGESCAVNLGIHLTFLPLNWNSSLPDLKKIKEVDCEFRRRLSPKMKSDYWWKYKSLFKSPLRHARHLIDTYIKYGEPCFQEYSTLDDIARMFSYEELGKGIFPRAFGATGSLRVALVMAYIHQHNGEIKLTQKYIKYGLENIESALGLKSQFVSLAKSLSLT